jgi:hypothetical protein
LIRGLVPHEVAGRSEQRQPPWVGADHQSELAKGDALIHRRLERSYTYDAGQPTGDTDGHSAEHQECPPA